MRMWTPTEVGIRLHERQLMLSEIFGQFLAVRT
jgi:hypothetical protein